MNAPLSYLTLQGRPQRVEEKDFRRYAIITVVALFGLVVHLALVFIFWHIGAKNLSLLNVASVAVWFGGLWLNVRGKHDSAIMLLSAEVIVHAWLVCATLGVDAGFQHYLWAISPLPILNTRLNLYLATVFSALFIFVFALMYHLYGATPYPFEYAKWLPAVHFANVLVGGIPFIIAIVVIRNITIIQEEYLQDLASKDSLTQLYNRRAVTDTANQVFAQAERSMMPLCIAMVDLDYFKMINDTHGHAEGDRVLQQVAVVMESRLRKGDILARWGGEEFLLLLPNTEGDKAVLLLEDIRQRVAADASHSAYRISISVGVIECTGVTDFDAAVHYADKAMYLSKAKGRDCITLLNPAAA